MKWYNEISWAGWGPHVQSHQASLRPEPPAHILPLHRSQAHQLIKRPRVSCRVVPVHDAAYRTSRELIPDKRDATQTSSEDHTLSNFQQVYVLSRKGVRLVRVRSPNSSDVRR